MYIHTYRYTYSCVYIYMFTNMYTYIYIYMHIYVLWTCPYWYATLASVRGTETTIWLFLFLGPMLT